ncbi:flagellar type III secretion system pore protein FliP [Paenibacillus monticola]|uniref:Flagellar biosynthetic protein FliP n=1 Tax=Paenibacillus monticola TaxID=2666075 RepID=A0A7X2H788_9BACL|nr:flagellar type III secretion system pore protein FliP [Paenibacillus monticola]MRN54854.1 flagellar type III secretion system pore protein FliP [Paenibacillus monticola]
MKKKLILAFLLLGILSVLMIRPIHADPIPNINIQVGNNDGSSGGTSSISILLLTTVLSVAPAFLMLMTSFTRIVIVLGFVRTSLGTQQMPPNQVLVGLALFLTLFIMSPTLATVNETALQPYIKGTITQTEALNKAADPMKEFMFKQTSTKDLLLFMNYTSKTSTTTKPANYSEIPLTVMVPAFAIGEMKKAFTMGFLIFIPFLIIDIVVASTLMAMGMMMLPPVMISLPFKIMLFVLVDGWYLVIKSLLLSFNP